MAKKSNDNPFYHVANLIRQLNINDDSILINRKIKDVTDDFNALVLDDENSIRDAFTYFNEKALLNSNFATNLALVFSSKSLNLISNSNKFRQEMINVLQQNFIHADEYKTKNIQQFYNSITLLGEYYNRYRICEKPVQILGQSLFELLTKQLLAETELCLNDASRTIDLEFCNVIFTQLMLNGSMAHDEHKGEMKSLLFAIRKCLICVPNLCDNVRAMLVMTIDLSSRNFSQNMDPDLQIFYEPYLCNVQKIVSQNGHSEEHCDAADESKSDGEPTDPYQSLKTKLSNGDDTVSRQQQKHQLRINAEYIGKPLNAAARLKLAQTQMQNKSCAEEEKLLKQFVTTVKDKKQSDAKASDSRAVLVDPYVSQSADDDQQYVPTPSILGLDTSFKIFANHRDGEIVDGHHANHTGGSSNNNSGWPQQTGNNKREGNYRQRGSNRRQQHGRERKNSTSSQHELTQSQNAGDYSTAVPIVRQNLRGGRGNRNGGSGGGGGDPLHGKNKNQNQDEKRFHIKSGTSTATDQKLFLQKRINGYLNKTNSIPKKKTLSASVENITTTEENWD